MALNPGTLIASSYQLIGVVGEGGMGQVWHASDQNLNRPVAIKVVPSHLLRASADLAPLLRDEARAASTLFNNPNIVAILDLVEHLDEGVRVPCVVMEYMPGTDGRSFARNRLAKRKDHLTRNALSLYAILRAAKGLMHAHEQGLIHRDIKPGNILIADSGAIKLSDFGIAKFLNEATRAHTKKNEGTLLYFAPEQAAGAPASQATDIYQLGCALYEMFEFKAPFEEKGNPLALLKAKLYELEPEPAQMSGLSDEEKTSVLSLYRRTVDVNPDSRPGAYEVVETLAKILHRPQWRLHFHKKKIPDKVLANIFAITRLQIDPFMNELELPSAEPLRYEDPEEALTEATALMMNDASQYIYLQRE